MEKNNDSIEVLPQSVVEKIAAGEIIERPASVLKELIENAIDAGSAKISVAIEDSGFSSIRVTDNGRGMDAQNLRKSILRHATSKIRTADDLYAVGSLGFRGEALASIAAVSRLTISSSSSSDGLGHSLDCEGGICTAVRPVSHVKGTTVISRDLFFNVPARKKFMKTRRAERIALLRLMEQLVIPFPEIHFTASFEGKTVLDVPMTGSVQMRIAQIAGTQFGKNLIVCSGGREGLSAEIYLSRPEESRVKPRFQNLYVNFRKVESDTVLYAIREAFAQFTISEFRPSFFCCIDVDPARIDVNVHPTKLKVKFEEEKMLFGFIFDIARRGITSTLVSRQEVFSEPANERSENLMQGAMDKNIEAKGASPVATQVKENEMLTGYEANPDRQKGQTMLSFPSPFKNENKALDSSADNTIQLSDSEREVAWSLISCYQIHCMFILAPIKNGILLIDQHAAHERILYEQALDELKDGKADSQQLLFPIVMEFSPIEKSVVLSGNDYFRKFGFDIQDFGGNAVSLEALPAFMKDSSAEPAVRDMVRYLLEEKSDAHFSDSHKRFAAAFACGSAIKAGQKLSQEEMNTLLNTLFSAENPYICPHGRPTLVRISTDELSRRFLR
ncbi:MAG: DNA mismatch repair endonuclease MutL [Chitinivibrionales bacterium]